MTIQQWNIDTSHSSVQFAVRHMVISKVRGAFSRWHGSLAFDERSPSDAQVAVRIEAASIDTREAQRDEHLRAADFLDAENHPYITFESTRVEKGADSRYRVLGDLTIRGVTRAVELDVEYLGAAKDPWGGERAGFHARTSINREDFGLVWNQVLEAGGVLVGDEVEIAIDIEALRTAAARSVLDQTARSA